MCKGRTVVGAFVMALGDLFLYSVSVDCDPSMAQWKKPGLVGRLAG